MKYLRIIYFAVLFMFPAVFYLNAQEIYEDRVYDQNIQSVRLFPMSGDFSDQMNSPVIALNAPKPLVLHFDDIAYEADMVSSKMIVCNADWNISGLRDADYLGQYNE
jgi:hypothetical protein